MTRRIRRLFLVFALALIAGTTATALRPTASVAANHAAAEDSALTPAPVGDAAVERIAPEPRGRQIVIAAPSATATEPPVLVTDAPIAVALVAPIAAPRVVPPVVTAPPVAATAPPATCPASFFCYPRLGITGAVIPYDDCSGKTDVGTAIRRLTCVRAGIWLAGHAYTPFGGITGYRVGDVVFVQGQRFEITGASVQRSCEVSTTAVAPLSLQTSLEAATCGRVLVVQGR